MKTKTIGKQASFHITAGDLEKLELLTQVGNGSDCDGACYVALAEKLDGAVLIQSQLLSRNVVTMRSRVRLVDLETSESLTFSLEFPQDASEELGKVSALDPLGLAMLGCQVGDEIEWDSVHGLRRLRVAKIVFQPEAERRLIAQRG